MEDTKQKDLTTEITQEMVEMQPLLLEPQRIDLLSTNHLEQQMEDDVVIEIEKMIQDNKDGLLSPTACCIYRVPPRTRKQNEDAYTPVVVSIGPFHYLNGRLQDMEKYKQVVFGRFRQEAKASLVEMVSLVKHLEPKVRASYSENIELTKKELVKLILVDAAFIIELFKSHHTDEIRKDSKLSQGHLGIAILEDLLLLENQLPFFLIEDLFDRAFPVDERGELPSFLDLTYSICAEFNIQNLEPSLDNNKIKHFTDLLRLFYLPRTRHTWDHLKGRDNLHYSANELQEAGLNFKGSASKCLLNLTFSRNVLEIPQILVEDDTELLFRNMIALEHCHYPYEPYIIDYAILIDLLINTNKDVDVLIHNKIIHNRLGDANDVATLFNGLGLNINHWRSSHEHLDIIKRLNEFYEDPWRKKKATLRRDYCNTPWKSMATIAGIIVIILTVIQTIFSILQVALKK